MPSILSGFDSVEQALAAHQFALSITQKNVANINNPAYTRQDVVFTENSADQTASGIPCVDLQASRNRYLDYSISRELPTLGESSVEYDALRQIDSILNRQDGAGLQDALSKFFNSFSSLSSNPSDINLRQQVLTCANALAREFQRLYGGIQQVQTALNQDVKTSVDEVNAATTRIADLNAKIAAAHAAHSEDEFTLRDARQQQLETLSNLMNISYYETESGSITVATGQGALLVMGDTCHNLELASMADSPFFGVSLDGADITDTLESGTLGGLIAMRDDRIAGYLNTLDDMAAGIIERVNEVHAQGDDVDGAAGGEFFSPFTQSIPGSNAGAARSMSVALTDPRAIAAAASGGGVGSNENAKLLAAIGNEALFSTATETAVDAYASLVYRVGADEREAEEAIATQDSLLAQLRNQRDAAAGVSLNEEAINIIKYQKAYQASARFANVLDSLSEEVLQLLGV